MLRSSASASKRAPIVIGIWLACRAGTALGSEFYVDPVDGAPGNDGSASRPWQTLEGVVAAGSFGSIIQAGDQVWLRSGYHGAFVVRGGSYATPIRVSAVPNQVPKVSHVSLSQTSGWTISGLSISPSYAALPDPLDMVLIDRSSSAVTLENCQIFSIADTSAWSALDWVNLPSSGISVRGDGITIRNNNVTNVRFGISVDGPNALIQHNQVVNFSADGIRGLGDYGVFEYNLVKNVYVDDAAGDTNHDDGFQSWSVGPNGPGDGIVTGVVLRGNVFVNREDPNQKFQNSMQGIGCFDGFFDDWVVENNVVVTDHWHGISFYGMRNSRIVNNTVVDINDVDPGPPWIMVTAHKDGTPSENVVVRNNLATDFSLEGQVITDDHNTTLTNLAAYFVAPPQFDFHLLPNAPAIDVGSSTEAPVLDADRILRPQGTAVDLGAYEWHDASVTPSAAGASGSIAAGGSGGTSRGIGGSGANEATAGVNGVARSATRAGEDSSCGCRTIGTNTGGWDKSAVLLLWLGLRRRQRRCGDVTARAHDSLALVKSGG